MHLAIVTSSPRQPSLIEPERQFRSRDLMAIATWKGKAEEHGYRRVLVVDGTSSPCPADGGYALVYASHRSWAAWGLARRGEVIAVWHCGTGVDCGQFATMEQALQSLPAGVERPSDVGSWSGGWSRAPRLSPTT